LESTFTIIQTPTGVRTGIGSFFLDYKHLSAPIRASDPVQYWKEIPNASDKRRTIRIQDGTVKDTVTGKVWRYEDYAAGII
jgi:hypothetical protein